MTALDVGCGAGILSESLGRLGFKSVLGIDPTPKCIELAQRHLELDVTGIKEVVKYENRTMESITDNKFDLVCVSEVIEHISEQKEFI